MADPTEEYTVDIGENPFAPANKSSLFGGSSPEAVDIGPNPFAPPSESSGGSNILRRGIVDPTLAVAEGAMVGIPEAVTGLADIPTFGMAGKVAERVGKNLGIGGFKQGHEFFEGLKTPETKEAVRKVSESEGFFPTLSTAVQNPSAIAQVVGQSIPPMLAGARGVRGVMKKMGKDVDELGISNAERTARGAVAGGVGEGLVTAGQNIEQMRQETPDQLLTGKQVATGVGSAVLTSLIGVAGGKLAARLGIDDINNMMAGVRSGSLDEPQKNILKRVLYGAIQEGAFEELPQSMQEQLAQNYALGKPLTDDVLEQGAIGLLSGVAQSTGTQVASSLMRKVAPPTVSYKVNSDREHAEIESMIREIDTEGILNQPTPVIKPLPMNPVVEEKVVPVTPTPTPTPAPATTPTTPTKLELENAQAGPVEQPTPTEQVVTQETTTEETPYIAPMGKPTALPFGQQQTPNYMYGKDISGPKFAERAPEPTRLTPYPSLSDQVASEANEAATAPSNNLPEPTEAQKEAGNYKMGHTNIQGLDISIENPAGSVRKGVDENGDAWETPISHHYGYIKKTEGKDGDHVDVFIGPNPESTNAYIVDQKDPVTNKFDEHKTLIGFNSLDEAREGYLANYDESGPSRIMGITEMPMDQFKTWLQGDTTKRVSKGNVETTPTPTPAPVAPPAAPTPSTLVSTNDDENRTLAGTLGITYNGNMSGKVFMFTEPTYGATFSVKSGEDVKAKLDETITKFKESGSKTAEEIVKSVPSQKGGAPNGQVRKTETEVVEGGTGEEKKTVTTAGPKIKGKGAGTQEVKAKIAKIKEGKEGKGKVAPPEKRAEPSGITEVKAKIAKVKSAAKDKVISPTAKEEATITTPKQQKKYLLESIDEAIPQASDDTTERFGDKPQKNIPNAEYLKWEAERKADYEKDKAKYGTVTIEIPNDGTYNILNTKQSLRAFKKMAEKNFPAVITPVGKDKSKPSIPSDKPKGNRIVQEGVTYYNEFQPRKQGLIEGDVIVNSGVGGGNTENAGEKRNYWSDGWFTQGNYAIKIPKPDLKILDREFDVKKVLPSDSNLEPAKLLGEFSSGDGVNIYAHLTSKSKPNIVTNAAQIDVILTQYPNATVHVGKGNNPQIVFKDGKETVGVVMPIPDSTTLLKDFQDRIKELYPELSPSTAAPTGPVTTFSDRIRTYMAESPAPGLSKYESQLADSENNELEVPKGERIALENLLYAESMQNTGAVGGTVSGSNMDVGHAVFKIHRPYGTVIYDEESGKLYAAPSPIASMMVAEDAKFGVDKTLLLQTLSKDIVNDDLSGTIANETIQNSLDAFMPNQKDKRVGIEIKSSYDDEGTLETVVTVSDNGKGMTPDQVRNKLLKLGSQGKPGTTSRGGYGLAKAAFILVPRRTEVITTHNGTQTRLFGTREQFFGVKGAGNPRIEITQVDPGTPNGTTFKMEFYSRQDDADKENSYALSSYVAENAFRHYINDGVMVDGVTISFKEEYENPVETVTQSPSALPQIMKKQKLSVQGNDLTLYFVEDKNPKSIGWDDKYHVRIRTFNKGLALFGIRDNEYSIHGLWEQPDWQLIVDFDKTVDVRDTKYPFLRNRTQMASLITSEIEKIVNAKIKDINDQRFAQNLSEFQKMVADAPVVEGIRVMIPFKDKTEVAKTKVLINNNTEMVSDLARLFNSFKSILTKIGEHDKELAITVDPKVHGFRPVKEVTGHEFYAINPFAITTNFLLNPAYKEIMAAGYDNLTAMSSNIVHTMVHEYTHNFVGEHSEQFTSKMAEIYMKMSHTQLSRLEQQARRFYEKHGQLLESLQTDFEGMGKSGSQFRSNSANVYPARDYTGGAENGRTVQTNSRTGEERPTGIVNPRSVSDVTTAALDAPFIRNLVELTNKFQSNPQSTIPDSWVKSDLTPFLQSQNDFRTREKYLGLPWWNAKRYPEWRRAFQIFGIERPEDRGRHMHTFSQIAEPFFRHEENMRKSGKSAQQIAESKSRIYRTIITGDAMLGPELRSLRAQIRTMKDDNPEKARIQSRIDQIESLNRYSDEELLSGITDDQGKKVTLTQDEIEVYKSVRSALDAMFDAYQTHLTAQAYRAYQSQKWYSILLQATGLDVADQSITMHLAKSMNKAALLRAKSIQPSIQHIFNRVEAEISKTPDEDKLKAGELYGKLSDKLTKEMKEFRDSIRTLTGIEDEAELTQISKDIFSAYLMTRPHTKKIKALRNLYRKQIAFFPRVREAGSYKFKVSKEVYDEAGNIVDIKQVYMKMFDNKTQGTQLYNDILNQYGKNGKLNPGYHVSLERSTQTPEFAFQGVNDINMQKVLDDAIEGLKIRNTYYNENGERVDIQDHLRNLGFQAIAKQFQSRGFGRHMTHRQATVVKGYQEEGLEQVLFNYMAGMSGIMTKQVAAADFLEHMKNVKNPKMFEALTKYGRDQLRNDTAMDKLSNKARSFMFTWYLGGVLRPALVQLTQNFVTGIPKHAKWLRENNLGGAGKADKDYITAMKDMATKNLTELEAKMEAQLFTDGVTVDQFIREISGSLGSRWNQNVEKWLGYLAYPFSRMEIFNRQSAALTRFRPAYEQNMKKVGKVIDGAAYTSEDAYTDAFNSARDFVYDTHYAMGKANLPQVAQGEGVGIAIRTAYTFKSFVHNFMLSLYYDTAAGDWKTVLHSLAYLSLFGGLLGLPFIDDLFEFTEKHTGYSPMSYVRKTLRGIGGKTLEQFGMNGLPAVLGANISGTLAIGVPFMGVDNLQTVGGVWTGQWEKINRAWEAFGRADYYRTATNLAPEFLRSPVTAAYESKIGKDLFGLPGHATTTRGRPVYDEKGKPLSMTTGQAITRSLGFQPTDYAEQKAKDQSLKRRTTWVTERKADIAETYRVQKINKDPDATKNMIAAVKELNSDIKARGLSKLVTKAKVSTIIESSKKKRTLQEKREDRYKRNEM